MRFNKTPRRGAYGILLLVVALSFSTLSPNAAAEDPTEYPAQYLNYDLYPVLDQIQAAPCLQTVVPCVPPIPKLSGSDLTGQVVAIAVGEIKASAGVIPGNTGPLLGLMAYCQPHLNQFLANTEYLGPLLDYGVCIEANSAPAVLAALPAPVTDVRYVAGACTLTTRTSEAASGTFSSRTRFSGTTDCGTGVGFTPSVTAQASLLDFLYGTPKGSGSATSGSRYASSTGYAAPIGTYPAKVKFRTTMLPNQTSYCPSGATCGYNWVVLANKSPNTGSTLTCNEATNDDRLDCLMDGVPVNSQTAASR